MWFGTAIHLNRLHAKDKCIAVGEAVIQPSNIVHDLGVLFDAELSMRDHVARTAQACFHCLRRLRFIWRQLARDVTAQLVAVLVLTRLDYCNAVLAGLPAVTLHPLHRVMNAAARPVFDLRPHDHMSAALRQLHWLPVEYRITYKLRLLTHLAINDRAPLYLADLLTAIANITSWTSLRSADRGDMYVLATRLELSERAFSVSGLKAFSDLPSELKSCRDTPVPKRKLKIFLFS
jgi:hypothetical protein